VTSGLLKPVSADTLARHARTAPTAKLFRQSSVGMVSTDPTDAKANLALSNADDGDALKENGTVVLKNGVLAHTAENSFNHER
jgi:hypothetical protein